MRGGAAGLPLPPVPAQRAGTQDPPGRESSCSPDSRLRKSWRHLHSPSLRGKSRLTACSHAAPPDRFTPRLPPLGAKAQTLSHHQQGWQGPLGPVNPGQQVEHGHTRWFSGSHHQGERRDTCEWSVAEDRGKAGCGKRSHQPNTRGIYCAHRVSWAWCFICPLSPARDDVGHHWGRFFSPSVLPSFLPSFIHSSLPAPAQGSCPQTMARMPSKSGPALAGRSLL